MLLTVTDPDKAPVPERVPERAWVAAAPDVKPCVGMNFVLSANPNP
jgi:hypothetical protein